MQGKLDLEPLVRRMGAARTLQRVMLQLAAQHHFHQLNLRQFAGFPAADEAAVAEVNDTAEKIVAFITSKKRVTRTEITRDCFKGNVHKTQIDDALSELLTANPARIFVQEERPERGKPTKFYTLNATNNTKFKKNQQPRGFAGSLHSNEPNEVDELPIADSSLVSDVRKSTNQPQTRMNPSDSLNSSVRSRKSESGEGYEKI